MSAGLFDTLDEAAQARFILATRIFGEFAPQTHSHLSVLSQEQIAEVNRRADMYLAGGRFKRPHSRQSHGLVPAYEIRPDGTRELLWMTEDAFIEKRIVNTGSVHDEEED